MYVLYTEFVVLLRHDDGKLSSIVRRIWCPYMHGARKPLSLAPFFTELDIASCNDSTEVNRIWCLLVQLSVQQSVYPYVTKAVCHPLKYFCHNG